MEVTKELILEKLQNVIDPELNISIVKLGLIYTVDLEKYTSEGIIEIQMTLTSPGCPVGPQIMTHVKQTLQGTLPEVKDVKIDLTFTPPWSPEKADPEIQEMFKQYM